MASVGQPGGRMIVCLMVWLDLFEGEEEKVEWISFKLKWNHIK